MVNKTLLKHQGALVQAPYLFPELGFFFLIAGYACVHGDTLLETPSGKVKISDWKGGELFSFDKESGKVIKAYATKSEMIGVARMYEIKTTCGQVIRATGSHKFLTPTGYVPLQELAFGHKLLSYASDRQESNEGIFRLAQHEDAQSLKQKPQDFQSSCCCGRRLGGGQPQLAKANDQDVPPLLTYAQICSHSCVKKDDCAPEQECSHLCQQCDRRGSYRSLSQKDHLDDSVVELRDASLSTGCTSVERLSPKLSLSNKDLSQKSIYNDQQAQQSLLCFYAIRSSVIESITDLGESVYYDLHVPCYNNYLAQGFINHNSGKTSALVDSTLRAVKYFSGKKDKEGRSPKIGICGITLTFLKKTFVGALVATFRNTRSAYTYDKAHNVIYVCSVELHLTPIQNEEDIFGYDWSCIGQYELICAKRGDVPIKYVVPGDEVWTRQGWKKVRAVLNRGVKQVRRLTTENGNSLLLTDDHRVFTEEKDYVESSCLTNGLSLVTATSTEENKDRKIHTENSKLYSKGSETKFEIVYDLDVEDAHEFFAGGILVHNCAIVDELDELPTYTANAVVTAINDRCRQSVIGCRSPFLIFATTSQGLKGTYQTIQKLKSKGIGYMIIRGKTMDNIHLPESYRKTMYAIYNEKERRCFLEGEFVSVDSGLTYPDYDPVYNRVDYSVYETIKDTETIYIGQDFNVGFNKAVAMVMRKGILYVAKIYSFPDIRRAPEVFRYDFKNNRIMWIPDATYNHHLPEYKRELRQSRIEVKYRAKNPLIKDRTFLINKLFYAERLVIPAECKDLDLALSIRQNDPVTGMPMKGKGESAPDHFTDPMEYACAYCAAWLPELKDLYKVVLGRRIEQRKAAGMMGEDEDSYKEFQIEKSLNQARDMEEE